MEAPKTQVQSSPVMVPGYVLINPPPRLEPEKQKESPAIELLSAFFWAIMLLLAFWFITGGYESLK